MTFLINKRFNLLFSFLFLSSCENTGVLLEPYIDPHIIFTSRRWWNYDIFITDIHGDKVTQLTKNKWLDFNPSISPDGNQLSFVSNRDGNREIYIMDLIWLDGFTQWEGRNLRNLTNSKENDWTPIFSPMSDKIVFTTYFPSNDNYDIFIINSDGTKKKNITKTTGYEKFPQFSHDGSFIIYQGWQKGKKEIFFTNLLENNTINLTRNNNSNDILSQGNAISPDDQKIVFTSDVDGNNNIYLMNIDGAELKQLTFNKSNDYEPIFSPDGLSIIFTSNRDGNREIYSVDSNGENLINISNNPSDDWSPKFYPDNKKIIFQSLREGVSNWEIFIMDNDGKNQRNITNSPGTDYSFIILPLINP